MKTLKYLIPIFVVAVIVTSCKKTVVKSDYRDQWMGEYAYVTDRDGGMEGIIYADKSGDRYVNIYIDGIGELKKMKIDEDGNLSLVQENYYWNNSFTGKFTEDNLCFEYYIQSESRIKVSYNCKKINGNTSTDREYPADYRDKWIGKYIDISAGTNGDPKSVFKVSYTKVGITTSEYPWEIIFNVAEDGSLTVVKPSVEWGNYNNFEGLFTEDQLSYHFQMLTQAGVINKNFVYQKEIPVK
jgi:hypothetical protein